MNRRALRILLQGPDGIQEVRVLARATLKTPAEMAQNMVASMRSLADAAAAGKCSGAELEAMADGWVASFAGEAAYLSVLQGRHLRRRR